MRHALGRALVAIATLTATRWTPLRAQDSQFGVRGLGTPGRFESVRSRATAGAFAPFDPLSALTEAPLADVPVLTADAMEGTSYRDANYGGTTTALRTTRFPLLNVAGPVMRRLAVAAGFTTYLDRTWDVTLRDSTTLRGTTERYTDEVTSDGSIADVRFAAASRLTRRIAIGGALHLLAGSTRETAERRFDDTTFHTVQQTADVRYSGLGFSGSVLLGLLPGVSLAAWARADNHLRSIITDSTISETPLPHSYGGGLLIAPVASVRLGASATWQTWSRAGAGAFNTRNWSVGGEIGGGRWPWRFGVRGGEFPFGSQTHPPTEFAVTTGTGYAFGQGRALLDLGLERLERRGSGLVERTWTLLAGFTVRP